MKITIPVSAGELVDKITILEIKSSFSDDEYILNELNSLNIAMFQTTMTFYIKEHMERLRKVNRKLWDIENRLRKLEKEERFDDEFIELARKVYKFNDKRAQIKKEINELTNSEVKEVKLYE